MACALDLTPETSSQNLLEMCKEDLAARPSGSQPEPSSSTTGPAADDDASTEADTEVDANSGVGADITAYADTEVDADTFDHTDTEVDADTFDYADTEVCSSSPSVAPAELATRLSGLTPEPASATAPSGSQPGANNTAAIRTATSRTIAVNIRPTDIQAIDSISNRELEQEAGADYPNGSCMAGPHQGRSRSPRPQVNYNWVWMPASEQSKHAARQGVQKSAQYLPPYAAHALQNLPPCIKKVLPTADPRHMEFSELFAHCLQKISAIRGNFPRRWYIGICHCPLWRWGLGHNIDYECMYLLVAGLSSETTRPLEKALIKHFQAQCNLMLQNIDPDASGSLLGRPHFLYVCFSSADSCNALIRRRRG